MKVEDYKDLGYTLNDVRQYSCFYLLHILWKLDIKHAMSMDTIRAYILRVSDKIGTQTGEDL